MGGRMLRGIMKFEKRDGPSFTSELGAFAVGRHASVKDELMLRRKNPTTAKNATEPYKNSCNRVLMHC